MMPAGRLYLKDLIIEMRRSVSPGYLEKLKAELNELDQQYVTLGRKRVKPSQCYRFNEDPAHIMFNTNCPEDLKSKVQAIISKYTIER